MLHTYTNKAKGSRSLSDCCFFTLNDDRLAKTRISMRLFERQEEANYSYRKHTFSHIYRAKEESSLPKDKKGYRIRLNVCNQLASIYFERMSENWNYRTARKESEYASEFICEDHYYKTPDRPIGQYAATIKTPKYHQKDDYETYLKLKDNKKFDLSNSRFKEWEESEKKRDKKFEEVIKIWEKQCPHWIIKPLYQLDAFDPLKTTLFIYIAGKKTTQAKKSKQKVK